VYAYQIHPREYSSHVAAQPVPGWPVEAAKRPQSSKNQIHPYPFPSSPLSGENVMNVKINEDWLATIIAFVLLILAMIGVISPAWMVF